MASKMSSVSKGCFAVDGNPKAAKNKKALLDPKTYLDAQTKEHHKRWEMVNEQLEEINSLADNINKSLQSKMLDDILNYVKTSYSNQNVATGKRTEIPAGALIMGVNMPDHFQFFSNLLQILKEEVTPHVALLQSRNCPNMRALMKSFGEQLILKVASEHLNTSEHNASLTEENAETFSQNFIWKKNIPLTLSVIENWYKEADHSLVSHSPRKKQKLVENKPVVVMMYDTESFKSQLIQDLIVMFTSLVPNVPIVILFGVATSWATVVDKQLPHSAIVNLSLEKFHAVLASEHLALIIKEIILSNNIAFMMTGKCLQILLDVFLCHDFSTKNFLNSLRFCILEHFYKKPESILCALSIASIKSQISNFTTKELQDFRKLSSVNKHISNVTSSQLNKFKNDDEFFKANMLDWMYRLKDFHQAFFPTLNCLHSICLSLPKHPLGKQLREIYYSCCQRPIVESDEFKEAELYWKVASKDQVEENLKNSIKLLQKPKGKSNIPKDLNCPKMFCVEETHKKLQDILERLQNDPNLDEISADENDQTKENEAPIEKVKYAYQLKEKLKSRVNKKSVRKMSKFEKLRLEAVNTWHELFETVLIKVESLPLYEAFYYNSASSLREQIVPSPRTSIQTALSNPYQYLKTDILNINLAGAIPKNAPDICIAYKLHSECGRIINLSDWLTAFHTIVTSSDDEDAPVTIDDVTHARFIRAASELQMLGFIRPTKHKTDHVMRLTW